MKVHGAGAQAQDRTNVGGYFAFGCPLEDFDLPAGQAGDMDFQVVAQRGPFEHGTVQLVA